MARRLFRASKLRTPSHVALLSFWSWENAYLYGSLLISQCFAIAAEDSGEEEIAAHVELGDSSIVEQSCKKKHLILHLLNLKTLRLSGAAPIRRFGLSPAGPALAHSFGRVSRSGASPNAIWSPS